MESIAPILWREFQENPDLARAHAQMIRAPHGLGYYGQLLAAWADQLSRLYQLRQPTRPAGRMMRCTTHQCQILARLIQRPPVFIGARRPYREREVASLVMHFKKRRYLALNSILLEDSAREVPNAQHCLKKPNYRMRH
jgi:hypothetical protein